MFIDCVPFVRHHGSLRGRHNQESTPFIFVCFSLWGCGRREQDKKCREEGLALASRRATRNSKVRSKDRWW